MIEMEVIILVTDLYYNQVHSISVFYRNQSIIDIAVYKGRGFECR
jgi:hypothetical protein